jgi:hypothetical protein
VFGHAFVNMALRRPVGLARQFDDAKADIANWEARAGLKPSRPQISIGRATQSWLAPLEARAPRTATAPVGNPPLEAAD